MRCHAFAIEKKPVDVVLVVNPGNLSFRPGKTETGARLPPLGVRVPGASGAVNLRPRAGPHGLPRRERQTLSGASFLTKTNCPL